MQKKSASKSAPRVVVEYPKESTVPQRFSGTAKLRGTNGAQVLREFISQYIAGKQGDSLAVGPANDAADPHAEIIASVRKILDDGGMGAEAIRSVVAALTAD